MPRADTQSALTSQGIADIRGDAKDEVMPALFILIIVVGIVLLLLGLFVEAVKFLLWLGIVIVVVGIIAWLLRSITGRNRA